MIEIRKLRREDMALAVGLRVLCWPEETAGLTDIRLNEKEEYDFFTEWAEHAEENDDVRLLLGAFEDEALLGVAFASFVDSKSVHKAGIELNGLWVYPAQRGRCISYLLLRELFLAFRPLGAEDMLVYNYHNAPSNTFYRRLGCRVINTEYQTKDNLPTDIFSGNIDAMLEIINQRSKSSKQDA